MSVKRHFFDALSNRDDRSAGFIPSMIDASCNIASKVEVIGDAVTEDADRSNALLAKNPLPQRTAKSDHELNSNPNAKETLVSRGFFKLASGKCFITLTDTHKRHVVTDNQSQPNIV